MIFFPAFIALAAWAGADGVWHHEPPGPYANAPAPPPSPLAPVVNIPGATVRVFSGDDVNVTRILDKDVNVVCYVISPGYHLGLGNHGPAISCVRIGEADEPKDSK